MTGFPRGPERTFLVDLSAYVAAELPEGETIEWATAARWCSGLLVGGGALVRTQHMIAFLPKRRPRIM